MNKTLIVLICCCYCSLQDTNALRASLLNKLGEQFSEALKNPSQYQQAVKKECGMFPEGQIFPYSLVAIAFCHQLFEAPDRKDELLPLIETLLLLGEQSVSSYLKVEDLSKLEGYQSQGTLLGNLTMALSAYRLAGGSNAKLVELQKHWVDQFRKELTDRKDTVLFSYPNLRWPFDTMPVLFAIELHNRVEGTSLADDLIATHFTELEKVWLDKKSLLPCSQVLQNGQLVNARGCDLSWRLALMAELDKPQSSVYYQRYVDKFWTKAMFSQGFREWADPENNRIDLDSGPIIGGIGSTATVLGLATTQAYNDKAKTTVLINQAQLMVSARTGKGAMAKMLVKTMDDALKQSGIHTNPKYLTGFLFGDVTTFYALSWTDYPDKVLGE